MSTRRPNSKRAQSVAGLLLTLLTWGAPATGQTGARSIAMFTVPPTPGIAALQARDLRWITTANDFDQTALSADAIDQEIARRLGAYDREAAIATYEVPINSKHLVAPKGLQRYTAFDGRLGVLTAPATVAAFSQDAYFWSYRGHHIAVSGDTHRDQLNVYAVARALEVLRLRYPDAYRRLFLDVRTFQPEPVQKITYNNRYSTVLFSFDQRSNFVLGGTAFGTACPAAPSGVQLCSNISVVSLNPVTIGGSIEGAGSQPIYRRSADESYMRYLREGIVETLVHEMLHRYVDYRFTHDPAYAELRRIRTVNDSILNLELEEAFVTATSIGYFLREGGLQGFVPFYYRGTFDINLQNLLRTNKAELDRVIALFNPAPTSKAYTQLLRLPILD